MRFVWNPIPSNIFIQNYKTSQIFTEYVCLEKEKLWYWPIDSVSQTFKSQF